MLKNSMRSWNLAILSLKSNRRTIMSGYTIFGIDVVIAASVFLFLFASAASVPYMFWSRKVVKIATGKFEVGNYDLKKGDMAHVWMIVGYFASAAVLITSPNAPSLLRFFCWWHVISYALYVPLVWMMYKKIQKAGKGDCGNFNYDLPVHLFK